MMGARSFIKEPNALLEAACKGFLATHPHLQYDESHRGACMPSKFPKLVEEWRRARSRGPYAEIFVPSANKLTYPTVIYRNSPGSSERVTLLSGGEFSNHLEIHHAHPADKCHHRCRGQWA